MITNITLENFKCFRHVSINPKLLTVLIGPNGTGKSSILQALLLLKQSVGERTISFQGECIDLGDSSAIMPNVSKDSDPFAFEIKGDIRREGERIEYQYFARFAPPHGSLGFSYGNLNTILKVHVGNRQRVYPLEVISDKYGSQPIIRIGPMQTECKRSRIIAGICELPSNDDWNGHLFNPAEETAILQEFGSRGPEVLSIPSFVLQHLRIVNAVRGLARPRYHLGDVFTENVSLQAGLSGQEEQTATNLGYSRASEESLSKLLTKVTGIGLRADTVPPQSVEVKALSASGSVNIVAEGFGTNSLILLFHQLITADKGATVLIEEPEIHLHPKAQAELAEVLAETAKAEDKQIIMTTHSEHLVERLLLLVAEGTLTADDLAIYSFSKDDKGECFAAEIVVTENGQVEGGLTDFYANNLDMLDRRVKALKRSQ